MQLMLPVLGFIPFILFLVSGQQNMLPVHNMQGALYEYFAQRILANSAWMLIGSWIVLVSLAYILYWINIRFDLLGQRTVLLSYLFLFFTTVPLINLYLFPAGLSLLCVVVGLVFIFSLYKKKNPLPDIFNAGLFCGMAVLCYPPTLFYIVVFVMAIAWLKQARVRDFMALIIGLVTPVWIAVGILLLWGDWPYSWAGFVQWFEIRTSWPPEIPGNSTLQLIWLVFILLTFPMVAVMARSRKDLGRRIISILSHFSWLSVALFLLFENVSFEIWSFMALHLSVLYSMAILNSRRSWLSNLLFLSFFVFLIVFQLDIIL